MIADKLFNMIYLEQLANTKPHSNYLFIGIVVYYSHCDVGTLAIE